MLELSIAKIGCYGSLQEIRELDTDDILDIIEFEQIHAAIEQYEYERARNGAR